MQTFDQELKKEFPNWDDKSVWSRLGEWKSQPVVKKIKVRQPRYVLPMLLTLIVLLAYCTVIHVKSKQNFWQAEQSVANVEKQLVGVEERVSRLGDAVSLVAIVSNENFSSVRRATGNNNLLFIETNWKINRLPIFLKMDEERKEDIKRKFIDGQLKNEEPDDGDWSEEPTL